MKSAEQAGAEHNPLGDRVSRLVCYPYFALAHRFHWWGESHIPRSGPVIFAANHQSFYDPVLLSLAAGRRIVYLALDYYFRYPVLGRLMRYYEAVPVNAEQPGTAPYVRMVRALRNGRACGIFPEGGRSPDGLPCHPHPGLGALALRTGAPIVPVTVWGAHRAWPPESLLPRPHTIRLLFHPPFTAEECVGPGLEDRAARREAVVRAVMDRIVHGVREMGYEESARAARSRLEREEADEKT